MQTATQPMQRHKQGNNWCRALISAGGVVLEGDLVVPPEASGMVVFAHDKRPGEDVIELAERVGLPLFATPDDTWTYALKLADLGLR